MPRFTITTLLWLTALFATGMGTFGPGWGVVLAVTACLTHWFRRRRPHSIRYLVGPAAGVLTVAFLVQAIEEAHPSARRTQSMNNMKQQMLSLLVYESSYRRFPPAYTTDAERAPLHSWRTLVLPFLEQQPLYKQIHADEPWDSPANTTLLDGRELWVYKNPRRPTQQGAPDETHYLAVVDDEAVLRPGQSASFADIRDGSSSTIVLIEVAGRGVRWYEPRDLTMDEAIDLLTGAADEHHEWVDPGFFVSTRYRGDGLSPRGVAFADGSVWPIGFVRTRELARALLTCAGGEQIPEDFDLKTPHRRAAFIGHVVHWRRVLSTALFVGLAIGPYFRRRAAIDEATSEELNHEDTKAPSEA